MSQETSNGAGEQAGAGTGSGTDGASSRARTFTEEFRVTGDALLSKVKALVREGNIRRITIKNEEKRTLVEIPLTLGVIGTALLPVWAAIGAIAALVANLTLTVERVETDEAPNGGPPAEEVA